MALSVLSSLLTSQLFAFLGSVALGPFGATTRSLALWYGSSEDHTPFSTTSRSPARPARGLCPTPVTVVRPLLR